MSDNENTGTPQVYILSVGQCGADSPQIKALFERNFKAKVDVAHTLEQALNLAKKNDYDLVLVNRILDQTGEEGLEMIQMMKAAGIERKVMLVSNYPDAQQHAISLGTCAGFGKNMLRDEQTVEIIKEALGTKK